MVFSRRYIHSAFVSTILSGAFLIALAGSSSAIPLGDAFKNNNKSATDDTLGYHPMNPATPPEDLSLHPNLTPFVNEAHPYPDYIRKFDSEGDFPALYLELLRTAPVDKVQSKIFNISAFKRARRIGVIGFENKTEAPFKDEDAGYTVASQISQELQSYPHYRVLPPAKVDEDVRLQITTTPTPSTAIPGGKEDLHPESENVETIPGLTYSNDKVDAVLIGAVTKYMDSYIDNRGEIRKSISSGVEFGAFLISTKTGEVLWGARYVGTQSPSLTGFLQGQTHWLSKEELSRTAMKHVLKAFQDVQSQP